MCGDYGAGYLLLGAGGYGQLGNGSRANSQIPVRVASDLKFVSVTTGQSQTCAIATDGNVYCWGFNGEGRLGNGGSTDALSPSLVLMPAGAKFF
jgi:serine/threonine-protein kinase